MPAIVSEYSFKKLRRILLVLCSTLFFIEYSNLYIENKVFEALGIGLRDPNVVINFIWIFFLYFLVKFIINSCKWSEIDFNKYNDAFFKKTFIPEFERYFPGLVSYQPSLISSIKLSLTPQQDYQRNVLADIYFRPRQNKYYYEYRLFSIKLDHICRYLPFATGSKCGGRINLIRKEATPCSMIMHGIRANRGLLYWLFYPSIKYENYQPAHALPFSKIHPLCWGVTFHTNLGRKYFVSHDNLLGTLYLPFLRGLLLKIRSYLHILFKTNYYLDNKLPIHFGIVVILSHYHEYLFWLIERIQGINLSSLTNTFLLAI